MSDESQVNDQDQRGDEVSFDDEVVTDVPQKSSAHKSGVGRRATARSNQVVNVNPVAQMQSEPGSMGLRGWLWNNLMQTTALVVLIFVFLRTDSFNRDEARAASARVDRMIIDAKELQLRLEERHIKEQERHIKDRIDAIRHGDDAVSKIVGALDKNAQAHTLAIERMATVVDAALVKLAPKSKTGPTP